MHPATFVALNVFIAKLIETWTKYLSVDVPNESTDIEIAESEDNGSEDTVQPSWFLPYLLTLQIFVAYLFFQTLRKFNLPHARTKRILITLIILEFLFVLMDALPFALYLNYKIDLFAPASSFNCAVSSFIVDVLQHSCVGLYLLLCCEVTGIIPSNVKSRKFPLIICSLLTFSISIPLSFNREEISDSCTLSQTLNVDLNYAHRLSSLHLLPSIVMATLLIFRQNHPKQDIRVMPEMPTAKGDEELSVLDMQTFTGSSMACHCLISFVSFILMCGVKVKYPVILDLLNRFEQPDHVLRKLSYFHNAANLICLLTCLNFENELPFPLEDTSEEFEDIYSNDIIEA